MGSSRRWWLNHETHSSVANSTASRFLQGPRRWMISALYSPLIVSARALTLLCQAGRTESAKSARISGYNSRTM